MALAFSPDGKLLAESNQRSVRLRDVAAGKVVRTFQTGRPTPVAFSPDGRTLAASTHEPDLTGGVTHRMVLWELLTGRECASFPAHSLHYTYSKNGLAFSADGRLLAGSCSSSWEQGKSLLVWDLATRKELGPFRGHLDLVNALAFSPDGGRLATASGDTTVLIWDLGPR